jgi:putative transposase
MDCGRHLFLTFQYRLRPRRRQHRALERCLKGERLLYNAALEERIGAWRKAGLSITRVDQFRAPRMARGDG